MKQYAFEKRFHTDWIRFENTLRYLEGSRREKKRLNSGLTSVSIDTFPNDYQQICQHLALAEQRGYSDGLIQRLKQNVMRGHRILYQRRTRFLHGFVTFVTKGFPQVVRREKKLIIILHLLFYGVALLSALISHLYPDSVLLVMNPYELHEMEAMYEKAGEYRPIGMRDSGSNWMMFAYYIFNNISVAFRTFAGGLIFCVGSIFILIFNAIHFGIVGMHLTAEGLGGNFWPFVIGHGAFELTAIIIAGAAGFKLGLSVLMPGQKTRWEALRAASKTAIELVFGVIFFLVIAAFIEAYWSSMHETIHLRYMVGTLLWASVFYYFARAGRA